MTGPVIRGRAGRTPLPFGIHPEETLGNRYQSSGIAGMPLYSPSFPNVARLRR